MTSCSHCVGSIQKKMIDLMVDSGAECTVCGPYDFPEFPIREGGKDVRLHAADGRALKWYGRKSVSFEAHDGEVLRVEFNVVDVTRPILSVASMTDNGNQVFLGRTGGEIRAVREGRWNRLGLLRCAGLFILRVSVASATSSEWTSAVSPAVYLAPVGAAPVGVQSKWASAVSPAMNLAPVGAAPVGVQPPVGVEMEGGAFQEGQEAADQARHAVPAPAPVRPTAEEVEAHMTTHTHHMRDGAMIVSWAVGGTTGMKKQATLSPTQHR